MTNNLDDWEKLDKLFRNYSLYSYNKIFQTALDRSNNSKDIIIFGAGQLGKKVAELLTISGLNVIGFCDNSISFAGVNILELPVYSPEELSRKFSKEILVIVSIWSYKHSYSQTLSQLENLGFKNVIHSLIPLVVYQKTKNYLPNYCLDNPHKIIQSKTKVIAAYKIIKEMGDYKSIEVYEKMIAFYFNPVADNIPVPTERKVFRELVDEVYVDTGAYIGQTVLDFIRDRASVYKSIYCFEPDRISFKRLSKNLEQYTRNGSSEINLINAAVGDLFKKVSFLHTGTWGSKVVNATNMFNTVDQYALDKYKWNALPTLIKFDIEGNELSALKGANSFIKNSTTVLSITAEHRIEDLWEIPLYLYAINPKRLIYLIPRDYEVGMDLVFYSVPQGRIVI